MRVLTGSVVLTEPQNYDFGLGFAVIRGQASTTEDVILVYELRELKAWRRSRNELREKIARFPDLADLLEFAEAETLRRAARCQAIRVRLYIARLRGA